MYAIIRDGRIVNTGTLESMFISNVFPDSATPEWLEEHNVYEIVTPAYDAETEMLESCDPIIEGRTVRIHQVVARPVIQPETIQIIENISADTIAIDTIAADTVGADSI